jgi:endonuclease/exonuclease/phosphatase family metal-dependent hydrolase
MIYIIIFLLIIFVPFLGIFLFLTFTEYKPSDIEDSIIYRKTKDKDWDGNLKVTTFNIGHCVMDEKRRKKAKDIKLSKHINRERTFDNLIAITQTIKDLDSDFVLLQEVDHDSARSNKINQIENITQDLILYNSSFVYNYNSKYVPFPMNNPVGSTKSGLLTLSKFKFSNSKRYQLDGFEKYPKSMFFLKRCMMINEYNITKNKILYIINIHISSYDKDNMFRTQQFQDMLGYINDLYDGRKNYIIVGGDFNYILNEKEFSKEVSPKVPLIPEELKESSFNAVTDIKVKTNAGSDGFMHSVDGFIVSKNIKVVSCKTVDKKFENSNHNPITLTFKL